jgi:hypothetical protein
VGRQLARDINSVVVLLCSHLLQVSREDPRDGHGYTWIITFIDVRLPTDEGLVPDGSNYNKAFVLDDPFHSVRHRRSLQRRAKRFFVGFCGHGEGSAPWLVSRLDAPASHRSCISSRPTASSLPVSPSDCLRVSQNLPGLEWYEVPYQWRRSGVGAVSGMLTGSGAEVDVNFIYGNPTDPEYEPARRGSEGDAAGAVYVYKRIGEAWFETQKLRGDDTDELDMFGSSVTIAGTPPAMRIAVGAPFAEDRGVLEKQYISCSE